MNPSDFIHKNITQQLEAQGFDSAVSKACADTALKHYKNLDNQNGKMFDVLLKEAVQQAKRLKKSNKG